MGVCGVNAVEESVVVREWRGDSSFSSVPPAIEPVSEESGADCIQGTNSMGETVIGEFLGFRCRSVFALFSKGAWMPAPGDHLSLINVRWGERIISVEKGRVGRVVEQSVDTAIEILLPGDWVSGHYSGEDFGESQSFGPAGLEFAPSRELALAVDSLEAFLQSLYDSLGPHQDGFPNQDSGLQVEGEKAFQGKWNREVFPAFSDGIQTFEWAAEQAAEAGEGAVFKEYCHRKLYPLMLCSPFISRVVERPVGVPGDFGMLGKILGDPFEGHSLFSRLVNGWILTTSAAEAYRHRVDLLTREIGSMEECANGQTRVLSLGCGVAYEIQAVMAVGGLDFSVDFELVDFNETTLEEASHSLLAMRELQELSRFQFEFVQKSVKELIRSASPARKGAFTLAYCTGLFDYLPDKVCVRVIRYLFEAIAPGGRAIVSNFTPFNPIKHFMELVLDWKLIHRSADELHDLIQEAALGVTGSFQIFSDPGEVECYGIIDKSLIL